MENQKENQNESISQEQNYPLIDRLEAQSTSIWIIDLDMFLSQLLWDIQSTTHQCRPKLKLDHQPLASLQLE